eukprot:9043705-Pyramimonas_sp.AAC.1
MLRMMIALPRSLQTADLPAADKKHFRTQRSKEIHKGDPSSPGQRQTWQSGENIWGVPWYSTFGRHGRYGRSATSPK